MDAPAVTVGSHALLKRSGLNWRVPDYMPRMPERALPAQPLRTRPESIAMPLVLGIVFGLALTAAALIFAEQPLNYVVARAALPEPGTVVFVRLSRNGHTTGGLFQRQLPVNVTLSAMQAKSESTSSALSATTDSYGMLKLPRLAEGEYSIKLSADGYETAVGTVTVKADRQNIIGWPQPLTLAQIDGG